MEANKKNRNTTLSPSEKTPEKAKRTRGILIAVLAVLCVMILAAVYFFVIRPANTIPANDPAQNDPTGTVPGERVLQTEPKPDSAFVSSASNDEYRYDIYEDYIEITKCLARTSNVITVPDTIEDKPVLSLKSGAFTGCALIEEITLPDALREIGESCFSGCTGLTFLKLPDSLYSIGDSAFQNCLSLSEIAIPAGVKRIGNYAFDMTPFYDNNHEEFLIVGDGVLIGYWGGGGNVSLPENVKMISSFSYDPGEETCPAILITGLTLPEGLEVIGDYSMTACLNLSEINFPSTLKEIGNYAFSGCAMLTDVRLPEGLETIGDHAFAFCDNLATVSYPASVSYIGADQFENGGGALTRIYLAPDSFALKHFQSTPYADLIVEDSE